MKARTLLLALCLMGTREMHATNEIAIVTNNPPGLVRLSTNVTGFAEAALSADDAKQVDTIRLIAWAAKSSELSLPPQVSEEAIVLVHWNREGAKGRWCLAHVMRGSDAAQHSWALWTSQPVFPTRKMYDSEPSEEEIAAFIKATSFGFNEHNADRHVLRVIAFQDGAAIAQALKEGVSESQKSERRAKLRAVFWHRRQ